MQFQQTDDNSYILRLYSGELVIETLTGFLKELGVGFASMSAIGAVEWAKLAYWNASTEQYEFRRFEEQMEMVSLSGNCSLKEGATGQGDAFLHVHCVLGKHDYSVVGGHLTEAQVRPTLEVWLQTRSNPVRRTHDPESGLDLLDLAGKLDQAGEAE